ncbi:MAG: hypothetical protein LBU98_01290, partial [Alistipes sp.]|nr:hypothetical protein [Alistipes sp.]
MMTALGEYMAGRGAVPTRRELNRILDRYEWFTLARRARALVTGEPDSSLVLPLIFWPTVEPCTREVPDSIPWAAVGTTDCVAKETKGNDLIDRFIAHGDYRIVPSDEAYEVEVEVDIDPQMVTPELAAIYRSQGLVAEAEK